MAPFVGPTREQVLSWLRGEKAMPDLPITLGLHEPQAVVEESGGVWRLRALELDREAAKAEGEARMSRGEPWIPEMEWRFIQPGRTLMSAASASALADALESFRWRYSR